MGTENKSYHDRMAERMKTEMIQSKRTRILANQRSIHKLQVSERRFALIQSTSWTVGNIPRLMFRFVEGCEKLKYEEANNTIKEMDTEAPDYSLLLKYATDDELKTEMTRRGLS